MNVRNHKQTNKQKCNEYFFIFYCLSNHTSIAANSYRFTSHNSNICNAPMNWYNFTAIASVHFDHMLRLLVRLSLSPLCDCRQPNTNTPTHQNSATITANRAGLASFISSRAIAWLISSMQHATCNILPQSLATSYMSLCVCLVVHPSDIHHNHHNH